MGQGTNGERFLAAFADIEGCFRDRLGLSGGRPVAFMQMLDDFDNRFSLGSRTRDDLRNYAELRNAIVHSARPQGAPIADPRDDTVGRIEEIRDHVRSPRKVLSVLPFRAVSRFSPDDLVGLVLAEVKAHDYSQFPIYEGSTFHGLLTTNCIARWLAAQLADVGLVEEQPIREVFQHREASDRAVHRSRGTTAAQAVAALSQRDANGYTPAALIITQTGRENESPLAVVVAADLPLLSTYT